MASRAPPGGGRAGGRIHSKQPGKTADMRNAHLGHIKFCRLVGGGGGGYRRIVIDIAVVMKPKTCVPVRVG